MGVVKLNKAEVYSVRLSEGSPIFTGGTDNAQSTAHFNNNVQISASNGTGILTVIETGTSEIKLQKDDARTTPAFKITNTDTTAEADAYMEFGTNQTGYANRFQIGMDADDGSFLINDGASFGTSGNVRMMIDTSGRFEIGTDHTMNPMNTLQISHNAADQDQGILIVRNDTTTNHDDLLGAIGFDSTDGNVPSSILEASAYIAGYANEAHGTGDKGGYLTIGISPENQNDDTTSTEYIELGKDGVEFNLHSTSDKGAYSYMCNFNSTDSTENNVKCIVVQRNGSDKIQMYSDGDIYGSGTYGIVSDARHKTNITELEDGILGRILQLRPVTFNWNEESGNNIEELQIGHIAQEVEKIFPELVIEHDQSGHGGLADEKGLNQTGFVPYLVKAIQELSAKVDELEKKLENK
jgi:hypothetical protein